MKKMLQRSISFVLAFALCICAMQFTALADSVSQANFQNLSEWIEMADDLLSKNKQYTSGKDAFDQAYNNAVALSEAGVASASQIEECIENLKTAWAGLKIESVTEIAPNGGIANDTGYANFGSSYKTASGKQPKIYYNINATGADFWADIEMIYVYAYGYQTDSVTEDLISGTTLPKGGTNAAPNGVRLSTTDYSKNAYPSANTEGWVNRASLKKIEFSKAKLSNFIAVGKLSQIMFCYQNDSSPNATLCAGSMFIVRSLTEQVPVSYELFKWVNRAENLLAQGKTYTSGLDEFNAAIDAAKNATDATQAKTLIANIKTTWQALKYEVKYDLGYPAITSGSNVTSTYEKESDDLGKKFVCVNSNGSKLMVRFDSATVNYYGADWFDDVEEIYFYIRGYQTAATTSPPDSNWTLLNINSSIYLGSGPSVTTTLNKFPIDVATFKTKLTDNSIKFQSLLLQQGSYAKASTWIVGTLYATKSAQETLPSDRLFNWIDRAENVLKAELNYSEGLDEFNAAITAMYNADATADEDKLVADLRAAWNNLYYDETVAIGAPSLEGVGNDITDSYTKEDDRLGDNYVCVQSNGTALKIRFDCDAETGFPTEWFENVKEIYFYTRGYQTENTAQKWGSQWTNANLNTNFSSNVYYGGSNVNLALSKYVINKDTVLTKLNGAAFRNILVIQNALNEADTWIAGTLYATKTYKLSLADYGDVNGDGGVDTRDLVRAKKYFAGITNDIATYALDMNDDNKNTTNDLIALINKLINVNTEYADNTVSENEVF